MPNHPPTAEEIAELCKGITDRQLLNKIEAIINEPLLDEIIDKLDAEKEHSFIKDKQYIKTSLINAPGSIADKMKFMNMVIDEGIIKPSGVIANFGAKTDLNRYVRRDLDAHMRSIYDFLADEFTGVNGKSKFTLASGMAVGEGEGFFVFMMKGVAKGRVGDLKYKDGDWEIKANGARWASAIRKPKAMTTIKTKVAKSLNVPVADVEPLLKDGFKANYLKKRELQKQLQKLKIQPKDWAEAIAAAFEDNFGQHADVSGFKDPKWITATSDNYNLVQKAYSRMVFTFYQNTDGFKYLTAFNQKEKAVLTIRGDKPDEVEKAIDNGLNVAMSAVEMITGGTGGFDTSPQYTLGRK